LARYIQYTSDAQVAYETAVEYSAGGSFGYYRFLTDYIDDESDDLELKVVPVLDPLTIYGILVPTCFNRKPKYAFVVTEMPKAEFMAEYPDSEATSIPWEQAESTGEGWVGSESIRIAEYWWCEEVKVKGKRRPKCVVRFCKTNGLEILPGTDGESSETIWPGSSIPIIPVLGKQMIMQGKPQLYSVVRPQKAAQQLINYSKSRIAETLSTSPISPFMVAEGQISGYEKQWSSMNTTMTPFLTYKVIDAQGRPVQAPQRQTFEPPIQSLSSFVMQEVEDMKATTGIYDAALGSSGTNETSGQMVMRRQQQSNLTTMHFMDNLERSFKQAGLVIAEMIPLIYDTARTIQILGEDEAPKVAIINQPHPDPATGKVVHHKITEAKFDVVVTMGRAFSSKRMESFDMMQQVIQANPNSFPLIADIFFRNSDMAGADQLADRFKTMLPPQVHQAEAQGQALPPEAQAQISQLHQQAAQATQIAQQLMQEKQGKMWETQGKLKEIDAKSQADMALERLKLENQLAIAEVQTKAQSAVERQQMYQDMVAQFHEQSHDVAMAAQGHQQALQQAQVQAANQSQQSAQDAAQGQQAQAQQAAMQQQQPDTSSQG
jgi:hypothetical protein